MTFSPDELSVVIPTRDRWPILARTLAALRAQTASGFEVIVSVDGLDQQVPDLGDGVRVTQQRVGGSGATRNAGVALSARSLILLLDDDMVADERLVERHLAAHDAHPEATSAVLGRADWHPDIERTSVTRWLDRTGLMFEFDSLEGSGGTDVGWSRLYSCNASMKRSLFVEVGGFDPTFLHYYDDTEFAYRLGKAGMSVIYEPDALTHHLQSVSWPDVERRFERVAIGERQMIAKHPEFAAWFEPRFRAALTKGEPRSWWPKVDDRLPAFAGRLLDRARLRTDTLRMQRLARPFLAMWERTGALVELQEYLGDDYDPSLLMRAAQAVDAEEDRVGDEDEFYRTSQMYLYDLTVFGLSGTKEPYHEVVRSLAESGSRLLDYGCGIGFDGVMFAEEGYDVSFADFANPSVEFLRWRLERRGLDASASVFDLDVHVPDGFDLAYSFDVIEHVEDPWAFLRELERRATTVVVNLLEPDPDDTHLHRPLPIEEIVAHARTHGLQHLSVHHGGRSHLVAYRSPAPPP